MHAGKKGLTQPLGLCFAFAVLLMGTGCETARETLGMDKQAPDEFSQAPLEGALKIPPCFDVLPAPRALARTDEGGEKEQDPFPSSAGPCAVAVNAHPTLGQKAFLKTVTQTSRGSKTVSAE